MELAGRKLGAPAGDSARLQRHGRGAGARREQRCHRFLHAHRQHRRYSGAHDGFQFDLLRIRSGGNVTTLTDSAGAQVGSYTYDAWGNTVASSGVRAGENPYRFSTKENIAGFYSYGFRFYAPGLGRWINRDPLEEAGGTDVYLFVGNNPTNMVDENGLLGVAVEGTVLGYNYNWHTPGYGRGGPDFLFDNGSARHFGNDVEKGWYPAADGLNPFGDPYKDMGYWSPCDDQSQTSYTLGVVGQQALVQAATGGAGNALRGGAAAAIAGRAAAANAAVDGAVFRSGSTLGYAFARAGGGVAVRNLATNGLVGGVSNLGMSAASGGVHNFREGASAFAQGAVSGTIAGGRSPVSPIGAVRAGAGGVAGGLVGRLF